MTNKKFAFNVSPEQEFSATAERLGGEDAYKQAKEEHKTVLDYRQWVQVRTPSFKAWFGDWENDPENASKVLNPDTGEPKVFYPEMLGDTLSIERMVEKKIPTKQKIKRTEYYQEDVDGFITRSSFEPFDGAKERTVSTWVETFQTQLEPVKEELLFRYDEFYKSVAVRSKGNGELVGVLIVSNSDIFKNENNTPASKTNLLCAI